MAHRVDGGHGQPGAVGEHADRAVELDETQAQRAALGFEAGQAFRCAAFGELGAARQRGIVEDELAVERHQPAVSGQRQRVDLQKFGVVLPVGRVEPLQNLRDRAQVRRREAEARQAGFDGAARGAVADIHRQAQQGLGPGRGQVLDLHAAGRRK